MTEGMQRRLAAILSADVVGYSRLMQADEAGTHTRLRARYRDYVEPKVTEHQGRVVKLMGDGFLAEFPSVVNAAQWAIDVQGEFARIATGEAPDCSAMASLSPPGCRRSPNPAASASPPTPTASWPARSARRSPTAAKWR
jgi:class 3 adenylate cyclase